MKVDERVSKYFADLNTNDLHIWQYISNNKKQCSESTIEELSQLCNSSKSSIYRFARKLNLNGYSELKYALKNDVNLNVMGDDILSAFCDNLTRSIGEYKKHDYTGVCDWIYHSQKVFLYGTGTLQRAVAQEMRRVFLSGNEHFYVTEGVDEIGVLTGTLTKDDLVIIISLKGQSDNAQQFAQQLVLQGVPFISITSFEENIISHLSNESVFVNTSELEIGVGRKYQVLDSYFILVNIIFLNYMAYKNQQG